MPQCRLRCSRATLRYALRLAACALLTLGGPAAALEKVSVQLRWTH